MLAGAPDLQLEKLKLGSKCIDAVSRFIPLVNLDAVYPAAH
jgi:hypothetical protein